MDLTELRVVFTLASFFCFLAIIAWAYSDRRRPAFDEAARLPFTDPEELAQQRRALLLANW